MSLWDKIKGVGKSVLGGVGDVAKRVAPLATFIPGVGPIAAGLIGAGGGLLGQLNDEDASWGGAFKDAAIGGATGYGGAKLIDRFAPGQLGQWANGTGGGGIPGVGGMPSGGQQYATTPDGIRYPTDLSPMAGGGGMGGGTDWGKILGAAGKYAPLAMGAAGAFQNAQNATQNRELTQEQIAQARAAIERQIMLQDRALQPISVQAPNYSMLFRSANPFSQRDGAVQMES